MVQQAIKIALNKTVDSVTIAADDTDIFALLLFYYHTLQITISIFMTSPEKNKYLIDIGASAEGCNSIVDASCRFTQFGLWTVGYGDSCLCA